MEKKFYLNYKVVILFFITSLLLLVTLNSSFFGFLNLDLSLVVDSSFYYSSADFFSNLEILGEDGRGAYRLFHLVDYLFLTQYTLLLALSIYLLLSKISLSSRFNWLLLFPFFAGFFDILEGVLIDISLTVYPTRIGFIGSILGYVTCAKFVFLLGAIVVVFLLFCITLWDRIRR